MGLWYPHSVGVTQRLRCFTLIFSEGSHSYRSVTLPHINIECHTLETSPYGGVITFSILVIIILPIEG